MAYILSCFNYYIISMYEKEKILREQRLAEATDKQYIGLEGKFGIILKCLGQPIVDYETQYYTSTEFEDTYIEASKKEEEAGIPTFEVGDDVAKLIAHGMVFSGLSRGFHLDIIYLEVTKDKNYDGCYELTVAYKGYTVYKEMGGELVAYYPLKEWEVIIDHLYAKAKEVYKKKMKEYVKEQEEEIKEEKLNFLERLRRLWNL